MDVYICAGGGEKSAATDKRWPNVAATTGPDIQVVWGVPGYLDSVAVWYTALTSHIEPPGVVTTIGREDAQGRRFPALNQRWASFQRLLGHCWHLPNVPRYEYFCHEVESGHSNNSKMYLIISRFKIHVLNNIY